MIHAVQSGARHLSNPAATTTLVRICRGPQSASCGREYARELLPWQGEDEIVSHGMCEECFERYMAKTEDGA